MNYETISTGLKQSALWKRYAVAISFCLLLILVFSLLKGCNSSGEPTQAAPAAEKPPSPKGTLRIAENVEDLVAECISEGKIFYEVEETKEVAPLVLNSEGEMELPPGIYRLRTIWELDQGQLDSESSDGSQFRFRDPSFKIRPDQSYVHAMTIQLPYSWKFPKLPEVSGATTFWQGKFHRKAGSKNESSAIAYKLKITSLHEETVDQFSCRWLRVEVETSSAVAPKVTETAFLAVDIKEWEANQEFVVRQGWIQATSEDIRTELETYTSSDSLNATEEQLPPLRHITLKFDRDRDVIAKKAIELDAPFPEDRLSLLDVLSLVMDANLEGASKLCTAMRAELSELKVSLDKDVFKTDGTLNCLAVKSQIVADDLQFELLRNDVVVPFSLVKVKITHPSLEASLTLSKHSPMDVDRPVEPIDIAQLASEADRLQALPQKTRFDLAAIPKEDGVQVHYTATTTDPNGSITYDATVSTLGTESREGRRWLKVEVTTNGSGEVFKEAAIVLVDPAEYAETHKVSILDGWLIYHGKDKEHVLPFALNGDMQKTEDDLQMLEFHMPQARLSVHDALFLLFNAELSQSPSKFRMLRGKIEGQIENSTGRVMTRQELKLKDLPAFPGKVWKFTAADDGALNYTFKRSEKIPFSVFSMDLTSGPDKLSTKLNSYVISTTATPSFNKEEWEKRVEDTQAQIRTWQESHPNYHFWTIRLNSKEDVRLLAEWAGYGKPQGKPIKRLFFLKPYDAIETTSETIQVKDGQVQFPDDAQFSGDCDEWIEEGRHWISQHEPSQYVPERVAPDKLPEGILVRINGQEIEERIPFESLDTEDQNWVRRVWANSLKTP